MQIIIPHKVNKYLLKQGSGDPKGVKILGKYLETAEQPTALPNCKNYRAMKICGDGE